MSETLPGDPPASKFPVIALRTLVVYLWVVVATAVLGIVAIGCSLFVPNGDVIHRIARLWGRSILVAGGIRVRVLGGEHLNPSRSCVYMCNHLSNFDIPVLLAHLPVQFRWLAKAELFRIPIFGRAMRGAGYISINRFDQKSAFASIDQAAARIRGGVSVMIFPEGTRSRDGRLQTFKKGGFVLAVDAGAPIVPLVIEGTERIMPKGSRQVYPHPVTLTVCPPIETSAYTRETKEALMQKVRECICSRLAESTGERRPC